MGVCSSNKKYLSSQEIQFIKLQIINCFFNILGNNQKTELGFFCKIHFNKKNNFIDVLITNNNLIEGNNISKSISIYKSGTKIEINLDDSRKKYIDYNNNISIIEIKESDNLIINSYLQIDDDLYNEQEIALSKIYKDKKIYILFKRYDENIYGKIKNVKNFSFEYNYSKERVSTGSLILNLSNFKLIGVHTGNSKKEYKEGIFITELIKNFWKENERNINNNEDKKTSIDDKARFEIKNEKKNLKKSDDENSHYYMKYLQALFLSFYKIEKLLFFKKINNYKVEILNNNSITNLLYKYMNNYEKNFPYCQNIFNEFGKNFTELDSLDINFEKLIDFILTELHKELKNKQTKNYELSKDYNNSKKSYKSFEKYYEQDKSIIQKIFFGIKEIIRKHSCCGIEENSFDYCKYIKFNLEEIEKSNNLQNLISNFENTKIKEKSKCSKCCKESDTFIQQKILKNQDILIIIICNKNKREIDCEITLEFKNNEYKLICCISVSEQENNFNIIYNSKNRWNIIRSDSKSEKEIGNKIMTLIKYPYVLYYEKKNKINNNFEKNINKVNKSSLNNDSKQKSYIYDNDINTIMDKNIINKYNNIINNNELNFLKNSKKMYTMKNLNYSTDIKEKNLNNVTDINLNKIYYNNYINKNNITLYNKLLNNNVFSNNVNNNTISYNNLDPHKNKTIFMKKNKNELIDNVHFNTIYIKNGKNILNNNSNFIMNNNIANIQNLEYNNNFKNQQQNQDDPIANNNLNLLKDKENSINDNGEENGEITLYFNFKNGKELYLDVQENYLFEKVIKNLKDKYLWLKNINVIDYYFNDRRIKKDKTVKDNGLKDNSTIFIKEK